MLVTFDDGEKQFFDKPIKVLNDLNFPCLHFLNMEPIIEGININGLVSYLINKDKRIFDYYNNNKISLQTITKKQINNFIKSHDKKNIFEKAKQYHGSWASLNDLEKCSNNKSIFFGNHLFNHYNAMNLNKDELKYQYFENKKYLDKFKNSINMFSYPYGQPKLSFNDTTNSLIKSFGADYIFSAYPLNFSKFSKNSLFHRLPMHNNNNNLSKIREHIATPPIREFIKNVINN